MAPSLDGSPGNIPATIANGRFSIGQKLCSGCFGEVFLAKDAEGGEEVAVKFEDIFSGFLEHEVSTLKRLQEHGGKRSQGFARLLHSGVEAGGYRCMVMDRLGSNLLQHMNALGGRLCEKTALLVAKQAISILEYLHSKRMVHRDIKPENFVTGLGARSHHLFLVDFGLAVEYHTGRSHVPLMPTTSFQGNFRYASRGAHRCQTQSRRDDLEALAYMLIFLTRGSLPWSNVKEEDWRVRSQKILEMKQATKPAELAAGLPKAFADLLDASMALDFQDRPDYEQLRNFFLDELSSLAKAEAIEAVEDSALQWIDSSAFNALVPIQERKEVRQPEDLPIALTRTVQRVKSMSSSRNRTPSSYLSSRTSNSTSPCSDNEGFYSQWVKRISGFASPGKSSPEIDTVAGCDSPIEDDGRIRPRLRRKITAVTLALLPCGGNSRVCASIGAVPRPMCGREAAAAGAAL